MKIKIKCEALCVCEDIRHLAGMLGHCFGFVPTKKQTNKETAKQKLLTEETEPKRYLRKDGIATTKLAKQHFICCLFFNL